MTPEEIIDAYNVVVEDINNRTAQEAARVGNSQRSLGLMAERVANPTGQTSGLANYTYNRTFRPVVDTTAAALTTQGTTQAMNTYLNNALRAAKNNYEDAKNRYTVASTAPSNTSGGDKQSPYEELTDNTFTMSKEIEYEPKGVVIGTGYTSDGNNSGRYMVNVADGKGGSNVYYSDNIKGPAGRVIGSGYSNGQLILNVVGADGKSKIVYITGSR